MGKLRVLSGKQICAILIENGFAQVRVRGSHILMQKRPSTNSTITVPVPNHRTLATGTLLSIIRQSQLPRSLFESR